VGFFPLDEARQARGKLSTVAVVNFPLVAERMTRGKFSTLIGHPIPASLTCRS
jgi:hypothetical protein